METLGDAKLVKLVQDALSEVIDPELQYNVVELGLVYLIDARNSDEIKVKMTFTTPACPYGPVLVQEAKVVVEKVKGVKKAVIEIVFSPVWTLEKASDEVKAQYQDFL